METTSLQKIYLDYNATTPLAPEVVDSVAEALTSAWANPSSSNKLGNHAKLLINDARHKVAQMIAAKDDEIIFTSGGTEANNMVLWSAMEYFNDHCCQHLNKSDSNTIKPHFVTTNVEHDAILLPLKHYEMKNRADVEWVDVSSTGGLVTIESIEKSIQANTCLVSVMLANNETGVIMPVADISKRIQRLNEKRKQEGLCRILVHTDAAQAIGKIDVNVEQLGVDYLTIVGHKFYGPRIGALYAKNVGDQQTPLYPLVFGGGQERGYRPGTENTPMICGLGSACELVYKNLPAYQRHMQDVRDLLERLLTEEFKDCAVINCGNVQRLPNTCNVSFKPTALSGGEILSRCPNLMASTGAACHGTGKPSAILMASGVSIELARSAIRLSVGRDTTSEQVHQVVDTLKSALKHE